jgi:hypothetical protein
MLAVVLCGALAGTIAPAGAAPETAKATVTIDGVHYTLPMARHFGDRALTARNPLCYVYEYFYMTIVDRELYINGELKYRAKPGDDVVVVYAEGVRVNGQPAPPQPARRLAQPPCVWSDIPQ